jgi:predicted MFS family arabinose efflux permease
MITPDLRRALTATAFFGASAGIFQATLNNYLAEVHHLDALARGWLELPRELPGFLLFAIAGALLSLLRETHMAALAMVMTAAGAIGLGYLAPSHALLVVFIVVWSLGDHIIFAVEGPIGLRLAVEGREGRRLGQFGGARNLGVIAGVGAVYLVSRALGDRFDIFYLLAAASAAVAGVLYAGLRVGHTDPPSRRLVFKRKYSLFYAISALFGVRKQIFLAFGAWVLIELHGVSVGTIALLYFIAATLGVILRPLLGEVIDWFGERKVLAVDELLLLAICLTYAFATDLFTPPWARYALYGAYILDIVLFGLRVARTTYLKKIVDVQSEITPSISLGITIDHAVAMTLPVISGWIWESFGFRWVFLLAGAIAVVGFLVCLRIKVPIKAIVGDASTLNG